MTISANIMMGQEGKGYALIRAIKTFEYENIQEMTLNVYIYIYIVYVDIYIYIYYSF